MRDVFPAIERRFRGNKRLEKLAWKIFHGHDGERVKNQTHVEVTCTNVDHEFDTFDTDEPVYSLTFWVYTQDRTPARAGKILAELRETFRYGDLDSDAFDTVLMAEVNQAGPMLEDGTYRASMDFTLHVSRRTKSPVSVLRAG